jgi:uncharacterized small protein (DUF1192 family)
VTRLTDEELETIARSFPTHLGEPALSVLIQRMVTELRALRSSALTAEIERMREVVELARQHRDHTRDLSVLARHGASGLELCGKLDTAQRKMHAAVDVLDRLLAAEGEK